MSDTEFLKQAVTARGANLDDLSKESPLLVVFLRHAGCPFCRETLAELQAKREAIESSGTRIVLVHMMSDADSVVFFRKYRLDDVPRISDPAQTLYQAFGLKRGTLTQVVGPSVWWQGFKATVLGGNLPGKPVGDIYQLPGAFLVHNGEIVRGFEAANSSDRPDYVDLATCELPTRATDQ